MARVGRWALVVPIAVAGAMTGLATVAVHSRLLMLVFALAATFAALVGLPPGWWSRVPFAAGWTAVVAVAAAGRPEGDYALAANTAGYVVLVVAVVLPMSALATLPVRRAHAHESDQGATRT